ncbi:MAG: type IIL restriction-modification enzyme MmeI [Chloroflexales bacterium]
MAHVWLRHGAWRGPFTLNDQPAHGITPFLTAPGSASGNPLRLKENEGKSFIGVYIMGIGFVLEPEEAQELIAKDPRNAEALFPYLNGEDLNSRPDQLPSRYVINFQDWPLEKAESYSDLMMIVYRQVKPYRENQNDKLGRELWWRFFRSRPELYATIAGMERVLAIALTSKYLSISKIATNVVFDQTAVIITIEKWAYFSTLCSTFHDAWVWNYGATMRNAGMRYSPSDVFETFPFPACLQEEASRQGAKPEEISRKAAKPQSRNSNVSDLSGLAALREPARLPGLSDFAALRENLDRIGAAYHAHRQHIMLTRQEGLTKTYNRFHSPDERSDDIAELRRLHVALDEAVAAAYGWGGPSTGSGQALELGHGFHQTKQGLRYTISEAARRAVLDGLLALNHQRYAEEVAEGLHDKKGSGARGQGSGKGRKPKGGDETEGQGRLL